MIYLLKFLIFLNLLPNIAEDRTMAEKVRAETLRSWEAYEKYAWPNDHLLPISGKASNWYANSIFIAPIDGYSTLKLMGFDKKAKRIEDYVVDSLHFDKDIDVKVFEVNIRILGGLLCMYEQTRNKVILDKASDFGDRLLKAFESPTGLPYYYVNLKTGKTKGNIVNLAEAGSYAFEFGILSYYTQNPKYYQAAKRSILKLNELRSSIGLFGRDIDVNTGKWTQQQSMAGAYADSYFEYLFKSWLLFGDQDLKDIWDQNISSIRKYLADEQDTLLWFCKSDMHTGKHVDYTITLWDAYLPALFVLSGDLERARKNFSTWEFIARKYTFPHWSYNYKVDSVVNGYYQLNPETIESAYYLYRRTKDEKYRAYGKAFFEKLYSNCRTEVAYCHIKDVRTMEKDDQMETFFIAETMKYLFLLLGNDDLVNIDDCIFNTEAHPFRKSNFNQKKAVKYLDLNLR